MMQKLSADLEWDEGRENWEGEAPAEPKRQRLANSEWRTVNGKWRVANSKLVFSERQASLCTQHFALRTRFRLAAIFANRCYKRHNPFGSWSLNRTEMVFRHLPSAKADGLPLR
jgi:hypothetical protein